MYYIFGGFPYIAIELQRNFYFIKSIIDAYLFGLGFVEAGRALQVYSSRQGIKMIYLIEDKDRVIRK